MVFLYEIYLLACRLSREWYTWMSGTIIIFFLLLRSTKDLTTYKQRTFERLKLCTAFFLLSSLWRQTHTIRQIAATHRGDKSPRLHCCCKRLLAFNLSLRFERQIAATKFSRNDWFSHVTRGDLLQQPIVATCRIVTCVSAFKLRPRPHVFGWIRNFFFPNTATVHTHPANSTANPNIFKSALQSGKKEKSATNPITCGRVNPDISNPMT